MFSALLGGDLVSGFKRRVRLIKLLRYPIVWYAHRAPVDREME